MWCAIIMLGSIHSPKGLRKVAKCTWITDTIYNKDGTTITKHCGAKVFNNKKHKLCPTHIIAIAAQVEEYAAKIRAGKEEPIDL